MALYKDVSSLEVVGYTVPKNETFSDGVHFILEKLDAIPEVDVEPVRHGLWIKITGMAPPEYHRKHVCSLCKTRALERTYREELSNYCPNCGAKMDGEVERT